MTGADIGAIAVAGGAWGTAFVQAYRTKLREARIKEETKRLDTTKEERTRAAEQYEILDRYRQEMARMQGLWETCEGKALMLQDQINKLFEGQGMLSERSKGVS